MSARIMTTSRVPTVVHTLAAASVDARRACAAFGLIARTSPHRCDPYPIDPTPEQLSAIRRSPITLVHGPSGAGKSRRLDGIEQKLIVDSTQVLWVQPIRDKSQAVFDVVGGSIEDTCSSLAMGGLSEPRLWAMPVAQLSAGEQARLELCITMHRAQAGDTVICDEFCTPLDRATAASVCATVRRWAMRKRVRFIAAGAHEDLGAMLGPSCTINARTGETSTKCTPPKTDPVRYEAGTISDYDQLGHLHYLGGRPATWTQIIRAVRVSPVVGEMLAGVLVVSMPTLNGVWRRQAWPNRYSDSDKRLAARRINRELRCLSRVVVEPRSRGLGIASGLVRAYLANPQTPACEAVAAMGAVCPFFARAGMTQYTIPLNTPTARLNDALHYLAIDPADLPRTKVEKSTLLHRELMQWARSTRMLRDPDTPVRAVALMALCKLLSRPRAYAWTQGGEHEQPTQPTH